MKKILNIGYGKELLYKTYRTSNMSSKWFYGTIELEDLGLYSIDNLSLKSTNTISSVIHNNIISLRKSDFIFMSYFYSSPLLLYSFLKLIGLYKNRKLVVVSHKRLKKGNGRIKHLFYSMIYKSIDYVLFHSNKNMQESIKMGLISKDKASVIDWGEDIRYIDKNRYYQNSDKEFPFFISTGREQRDFNLLVSVFAGNNIPLEIYTNRINYDNNYDYLSVMRNKFPNIKIHFVEKDNDTTLFLARRTSEALCVVIPLINDKIDYCVGLTSVVEAMAMGKPIISSRNTYYPIDIEKENIGIYVDDDTSWREAISFLYNHQDIAQEMGKRARKLAEEKYNMFCCYQQLNSVLKQLLVI